jgi:hypothetical protein
MKTQALLEEGGALVRSAQEGGATVRLLGGAAVILHCSGRPHRDIGDLDAVTTRADVSRLTQVLQQRGYQPETRFNALHGDRRLIFHGSAGKLDIFVDTFDMCHRIELAGRLGLDSPTIPATDLLLTKLQVVELTAKDASDLAELLSHHALGSGPGDHFDVPYLEGLVADDWGLWRTLTGTLTRLAERHENVAEPSRALRQLLDDTPKGRRFRLRARLGERKRWYELPDEVEIE